MLSCAQSDFMYGTLWVSVKVMTPLAIDKKFEILKNLFRLEFSCKRYRTLHGYIILQYGTGFALKVLRVRSLLVVDYQIIIILCSSLKIPCQCHAGEFFYCTVLPWLQNSHWGPNSSTVLYDACVVTKFLLESLLIVHSILHVFIPKREVIASLLMSLGDIVWVSVDMSFATLE